MGQSQKYHIGRLRDLFRRSILKFEIRQVEQGGMGFKNRLSGKATGRRKDHLRQGMTDEQPEQFLSRIAACPIYAYLSS